MRRLILSKRPTQRAAIGTCLRSVHTTHPVSSPYLKPFLPHKVLEQRAKEAQQVEREISTAATIPSSSPAKTKANTNGEAQFLSYWNWLRESGAEHSPLGIMTDQKTGLRGLYATEDIPAGQVVASIPFRCCLSSSTFSASAATNHLNVPPPHYLLQAYNHQGKFLRRRKNTVELATPFEVQHMWLACVISVLKHRSRSQQQNDTPNTSKSLPYQHLVDVFPTNTSDFSLGVKKSWPKLTNEERKDFMSLADEHEAMVRRLHSIWMKWLKKTGRDIVEEKTPAAKDGTGETEEQEETEEAEEEDSDGEFGDRNGKGKSTQAQVPASEQVSASLMELRWAYRMVLSRSTLLPSLCEPSAPEDVNAFLEKHEEDENSRVNGIPCIIPIVDLINHATVASSSSPSSSHLSIKYSANCEVLTARRHASTEEVGEIADGLLAHLAAKEANKGHSTWTERLEQRRKERQLLDQGSAAAAAAEVTLSDEPDSTANESPKMPAIASPASNTIATQPAEFEADCIDRGVVVLMAVEPIVSGTPVLVEYDLADKPVSLLRYGFLQ